MTQTPSRNIYDVNMIKCFQEPAAAPATDENENETKGEAPSGGAPEVGVEVVNQQCCTGSKACLIL